MKSQSTTFQSKGMLYVAIFAAAAMFVPFGHDHAYGQQGQGKGGGHSATGDHGHTGGGQGKGQGKGVGKGQGKGRGSDVEEGVMRGKGKYSDFIREDKDDHDHDDSDHADDGDDHDHDDSDKEDSDRPDHAGPDATAPKPGRGGNKGSATGGRGDLFGDLWIIARDPLTGEPILYIWQDTDGDGELDPVQDANGFPQPVDAEGNLIPLDDEGHPIDETLTQEVELGRLNVARAPDTVLVRSYDEVLDTLNSATDVQTDASGRLMALVDDNWVSIDSPLENLALYVSLIDDGTIEGLENTAVASAFPNLVDGILDKTDIQMASTFFAAAADKVGTITLDEAMYINNIIGIEMDDSDLTILTTFTYDRASIYSGITATVLVDPEQDGTWVVETVNIYDAVFDSANVKLDGATGFAQSTDDARAVVNFLHEYEVPSYDPEASDH